MYIKWRSEALVIQRTNSLSISATPEMLLEIQNLPMHIQQGSSRALQQNCSRVSSIPGKYIPTRQQAKELCNLAIAYSHYSRFNLVSDKDWFMSIMRIPEKDVDKTNFATSELIPD